MCSVTVKIQLIFGINYNQQFTGTTDGQTGDIDLICLVGYFVVYTRFVFIEFSCCETLFVVGGHDVVIFVLFELHYFPFGRLQYFR